LFSPPGPFSELAARVGSARVIKTRVGTLLFRSFIQSGERPWDRHSANRLGKLLIGWQDGASFDGGAIGAMAWSVLPS
jgi:hypothetical protein